MKSKISYSLLAAALACGIAQGAATAYTTPVGYETLTLKAGINYSGLRLQGSAIVSGLLTGVSGSPSAKTVSDSTKATFGLTAGTKYILEISPSGFIQVIDGSAAVGGTITTPDDLLAAGVAAGNSYTIRAAATVASVFGAVPATLATGFGGYGSADQLYIPNAAGVLKTYYYDTFGQFSDPNPGPGWYEINADGSTSLIANPASLTMPYDEGFIFSAVADTSLTVSGTVKTKSTMLAVASGINYVGSVSPVGATLVTTFGAVPTGLATGFGGYGSADQLYVVNAAGSLRTYYYDTFGQFSDPNPGAGWYEINADGSTTLINAATVTMSSGYILSAVAPANILSNVPASYNNL